MELDLATTNRLGNELLNRKPFSLEVLAHDEVEPGYLYFGEGGNIGSLAICLSNLPDGTQSFAGLGYTKEGYKLRRETSEPQACHGKYFRALERLFPAPTELGDPALLAWIHRISCSHSRRLIADFQNVDPSLKQLELYQNLLDEMRLSLESMERHPLLQPDMC